MSWVRLPAMLLAAGWMATVLTHVAATQLDDFYRLMYNCSRRCTPVFSEVGTIASRRPDAAGIRCRGRPVFSSATV